MIVHALTPSARPGNLSKVAASLSFAMRNAPGVDLVWHVSIDHNREHVGGWGLRNQMLAEWPRDTHSWVWLLDDDTVAHPNVLRTFYELVGKNGGGIHADIFLFAQTRPGGWEPGCADPDRLAHGGGLKDGQCAFDAGQAFWRRALLGCYDPEQRVEYRFVEGDHSADGKFWDDILKPAHHDRPDRTVWTPDVLAYYNKLR